MSAIDRLYTAVQEGINLTASSPGKPEAVLRAAVEPALEEALAERGARSRRRVEVHLDVPSESTASLLDAPLLSRGRADAIFNRFVIEFEPPGALRPSIMHSATQHAVSQVKQYLRGVADDARLPIERLAGCAFDGVWLVYVTAQKNEWQVQAPIRVDMDSLAVLVNTLESLSAGRGLTTENLEDDFGKDSHAASTVVQALTSILLSTPSPRTKSLLNQWRIDIGDASGFGPSNDIPEWVDLCSTLGVPSDEPAMGNVLFALQTYFALVARLFAVVVLEGATGQQLVSKLREESVWSALAKLESGELTSSAYAANVIELGIFSWYALEQNVQLEKALDGLISRIEEYSAEVVEITPLIARDVFKTLYQQLVPREIRHRLGEFYTPDWLATYVVGLIDSDQQLISHKTRILDPACGSGTFLVEILTRVLQRARQEDPGALLESITRNIVGFDLSPLAVQAARVNYLLAIAPLIRKAKGNVVLPIFLADSVAPPRSGDLLEGDIFKIRTSEGDWRIPSQVSDITTFSEMSHVFMNGVYAKENFETVLPRFQARVARLPWRTEAFRDNLFGLYSKVANLHASNRNGIWLSLIGNALAPTFEEKFDYIVGNPPWVSWETLPQQYRDDNADLWDLYKLHPDIPKGRRQRSERVRLDLAMLFVARSMDRYLKPGGRLAFLITASVFQSELAGRGFRGRFLPDGSTYAFLHIEDLSRLNVFEDASNRTSVLLAERSGSHSGSIPTIVWLPRESATISFSAPLEEVLQVVRRELLAAEPVASSDPRSPLLIMPERILKASRPLRRPSPYVSKIREGVNTRGANGIFFVDILDQGVDWVTIRNDPHRGDARDIPTIEGTVESEAVRYLIRGKDVSADRVESKIGILFFHDENHLSQPLTESEAAKRFPKAFAFALRFRPFLKRRKVFRNFDPTGSGWLGIYSVTTAALADHKVFIREISSDLIAAAVSGREMIPDHKLHVIPCASRAEARRLAYALNSEPVRAMVRSYCISTSLTGSFLNYIGIRDVRAPNGKKEGTDEWLAEVLGIDVKSLKAIKAAP